MSINALINNIPTINPWTRKRSFER